MLVLVLPHDQTIKIYDFMNMLAFANSCTFLYFVDYEQTTSTSST